MNKNKYRYNLTETGCCALSSEIIDWFMEILSCYNSSDISNDILPKVLQISKSPHLQKQYLSEYVKSVKIKLPYPPPPRPIVENSSTKKKNKGRKVISTFNYVPIKELVKSKVVKCPFLVNILKKENIEKTIVQEKLKNGIGRTIECYRSVLDCSMKRYLAQAGKLRLELAIDDFTPTNPLGAARNDYKMLAVYMSINNIPFKLRSKNANIDIVMLCNRRVLCNYDLKDVFKHLLQDINDIEMNGITIEIDGQSLHLEVVLSALIGDNLGMCEILGLNRGFSRGFCRYCGSTNSAYQSLESNCPIFEDHNLQRAKDIPGYFTAESVFNELNNFDIFGISPPDILHDLDEGCIPKILNLVIPSMARKLGVSNGNMIQNLNTIVTSMPWVYGAVNFNIDLNVCGNAIQVISL